MEMQTLRRGSRVRPFWEKVARVLVIGLGVLVLSSPLLSQSSTGRILGDVRDPSGALIVGATVEITDVQRGVTRTLQTDSAGEYAAPNLDPGIYRVAVTKPGFKRFERTNIQLEVASDARIDVVLQPGDATQTVIVNEEVPLLNTTSSTLGGTLSNEEITDLPLNGRNYENLLQLRPGVMRYPGGGFSTTSTDGLRAEDNAYFVEGLFNSEPFSGQSIINGAGIAGDSATILPIDSIQEFNVQQNPSAEYGWKPGTIIKDKLFFFGGYEGQRYKVGNSFVEGQPNTVPFPNNPASNCTFISVGDCANSIPDAIADVHAAFLAGMSPDVSPVSLQVAGCQFTPPTATTC